MLKRIMVVLPFYGGSLPVGKYCAAALRGNGCLVDVFEAPLFYGGMNAFKALKVSQDRLDYLENAFLGVLGDAFLAQAERFQPDLVLSMAQAPLGRKVLKRLRHDGIPTAMWFVEDFRLFGYWRAFAQLYDFFAVIQKEPFLGELRALGVENALYLPLAALPEQHRPLSADELGEGDRLRFGADLSFMGAGYPNRRAAFRRLTGYDFKIWGTEWEGESALEPHWRMKGTRISPDESVRIFNAAKINLNLHSSVRPEEAVSFGDFVNPRTFEIAACGAFQLVDERGLMPELFGPDELATFNSLDDLLAKIDYYLPRAEERAAIAQKGRKRALRDHTYQKRMQTLLDFVAERRPGWPAARRKSNWPDDLPAELKQELSALFAHLQLPAEPDFETVIAALRARNDKLSGLECALLFLDEWKKQYAGA